VTSLLALILLGALIYFLVLWLLGLRPSQLREPSLRHG